MMRDIVLLAFAIAIVLLLGALAVAGGIPFYPYFLLLYSLAFAFVALLMYAGARWLRLRSQLLYSISVLITAGGISVFLAQVMQTSFEEVKPLGFLIFLSTVLLPYVVANVVAYFWISKRGY
jgi:hypothetical protein